MKALGIVRKVDELGRIVLPIELRRSLNIVEGEPLEILADEKGLYLRKYVAGCMICKGLEGLVEFGGTKLCKKCAQVIVDK